MNWQDVRALLAQGAQGAQGAANTAQFVVSHDIAPRMQTAWQSIRNILPNMTVQARQNNVPYWMVPQADGSTGAAPVAMQAPAQVPMQPTMQPTNSEPAQPGQPGLFDDIQAETAKREAIVNQLGDFSRRVLTNSAIMGGE